MDSHGKQAIIVPPGVNWWPTTRQVRGDQRLIGSRFGAEEAQADPSGKGQPEGDNDLRRIG